MFDIVAIKNRVIEIAQALPHFVYESTGDGCQNIRDGQGDCIVGRAMLDTGSMTPEVMEERYKDTAIHQICYELMSSEEMDANADVLCFLQDVQDRQDDGVPWAKAVELAKQDEGSKHSYRRWWLNG